MSIRSLPYRPQAEVWSLEVPPRLVVDRPFRGVPHSPCVVDNAPVLVLELWLQVDHLRHYVSIGQVNPGQLWKVLYLLISLL